MKRILVASRAVTVRRAVRNALIDLQFGLPLGAAYVRMRRQSNCDYDDLEQIFVDDLIDPNDVLVDVGCGAGRVMNQWLRMGVDGPIYGLEQDERLAAWNRRRLRKYRNVSVIAGDAVANLPADGTVFFLFDTFDESTTRQFADAVHRLASDAGRGVMIYYFDGKHVAAFHDDPRFRVAEERLDPSEVTGRRRLATVTLR